MNAGSSEHTPNELDVLLLELALARQELPVHRLGEPDDSMLISKVDLFLVIQNEAAYTHEPVQADQNDLDMLVSSTSHAEAQAPANRQTIKKRADGSDA